MNINKTYKFALTFFILYNCGLSTAKYVNDGTKKGSESSTYRNFFYNIFYPNSINENKGYKTPKIFGFFKEIPDPFENVNVNSKEQNLKESAWTKNFFELNEGDIDAYDNLFGKEYHRQSLDALSPDSEYDYKAYPHCWALYKNNTELTKNILDNYPEAYGKYECDSIEEETVIIASRLRSDIKRKLGEPRVSNNFLELTELFLKNGKVKYDMNKLITFHGAAENEEMVNLLFKYVKKDELKKWTEADPHCYKNPLWLMSFSNKINIRSYLSILNTYYEKGFRPEPYFKIAARRGNLIFFKFFKEFSPKIDIRNGYDGTKNYHWKDPLVGAIRCLRHQQESNSRVNCIDIAKLILDKSKKPICEPIVDYAKEELLDYNEMVKLFEAHNDKLDK